MKTVTKYFLLAFSLLIIIGCSEKKSEVNAETSKNASFIPDKKLCEMLTKETMSKITGIDFTEEMSTLHQTDNASGKYVSQCGYDTDKGHMGVLVRRFGDTAFPTVKEKLIGGPDTGDAELDSMKETAVQTARTVSGLGDAAYFYNLGGINTLVVIFQKHYQVHITSIGQRFGFDDKTLAISEKVAQEVIKIFNQ